MYWVTGILGFLFAISPYLFGYSNNPAALWTSLVLGVGVMGISFMEGAARGKEQWEYVVSVLAGLAAIAAPFVFGFGNHPTATWTTVVLGGVLTFFAASKIYSGGTSTTDIE